MSKRVSKLAILIVVLTMILPVSVLGQGGGGIAHVTLLHTNDFHGQLQADSAGRGGAANLAGQINRVKDEVGAENVALLDAGDVYFAAQPISQLLMGESTIDIWNTIGYDLAVLGNHEFDKGQDMLSERVAQSNFPWLGANVVLEGTEWDLPDWAQAYSILEVGTKANRVKLGILGLAGPETPEVTLLGTTDGLVFKDLTDTIVHYYDEILSQADALVVVVHMGTDDSGPYKGLVTVAQELIDAGKPVDLMIGGHQHQALSEPVYVGDTAIVSAGYYGRYLGQVDIAVDRQTKRVSVDDYQMYTITNPSVSIQDLMASVQSLCDADQIADDGVCNSLLQKLDQAQAAWDRGQANVVINVLGAFADEVEAQSDKLIPADAATALITDAGTVLSTMPDLAVAQRVAYWADIVTPVVNQVVGYTNISLARNYGDESSMGDLVADSMLWKADESDDGVSNDSVDLAFTNPGGLRADIVLPDGASLPYPVTWGDTFNVLPFGNTLYLMDLTGAQIQDILDQAAKQYKGMIQSSGVSFYWYNDCGCGTPTTWGAYGVEINGEPLVRDQTYRVVTNNFLAGGQDGWSTFADGTNRWDTYLDMQQGLVEYVGMLETLDAEDIPTGRATQLDNVVTILHTNDIHGAFAADSRGRGFVTLAALIKKERAHNPDALLLDAGDTYQGNSFAYFFKDLDPNPISGSLNLMGYDALTVGNHEFNFGPTTFATMLGQLDFPILGKLNIVDDGSYGFINDYMQDYINLEVNGLKVTIFGLTNPRIYRYELPSNIPGLTFVSAYDVAKETVPELRANENPDLLVGLTHIGYHGTEDEPEADTLLSQDIAGIDVIVGGHSHSTINPAELVSSDINPNGTLVAQTGSGGRSLGKIDVGFIDGQIVLREGYLLSTNEASPDPEMTAYLAPFLAQIDEYNATVIGQTTVPIDARQAYTQETNGANLQADAAIWELAEKGITSALHLSGAMSNRGIAADASPDNPVTLTVSDMFNLMPYENSLLVIKMNGPQIKNVLERGYHNYWCYKYGDDPSCEGISHYTTCMLDTNFGRQISYYDPGAAVPPDGNNVVSLTIDGVPVDFTDADTYYQVSTVNYLAAGSCNFNDAGVTIWPLDQVVDDPQLYVRDSVIHYVDAQDGTIAPVIDGRLVFQSEPAP